MRLPVMLMTARFVAGIIIILQTVFVKYGEGRKKLLPIWRECGTLINAVNGKIARSAAEREWRSPAV